MIERLLSAAEAAEAINPTLDIGTFRRAAQRHQVPYLKLGRQRYYTEAAIAALVEAMTTWPEGDADPGSIGAADAGASAGRKTDARASEAQARQTVRQLKNALKRSSPPAASAQPAPVVRLPISSPTS